ncbi:MAG: hypothetical protein WAL38_27090 [Solirubrobacteraceae bacterium]
MPQAATGRSDVEGLVYEVPQRYLLVLTYAATRSGRPTGGPSRFLTEARLIDPPQAIAA